MVGQELAVRSSYGPDIVQAETGEGELRLLPLAWTSLRPRRAPLDHLGQAVRLDPEALLELAAWVEARKGRSASAGSGKLAPEIGAGENRIQDVQGTRRGADSADALVGQAHSPDAGSRVEQGDGGQR
jgi:hypothetical protein